MPTLQERDQNCLWHPYTQHATADAPIGIVKGKDALLWDEHGNEYIDAIASWWVNPFGHCHSALTQAACKQLSTLEHVLFGGFTHAPAVELAEKLLAHLPSNQQKIFYSDNGSTAVEVALKMALQFFFNQGQKRHVVVAFENAFHGDTFAAMAASGISFFTKAFEKQLIEVVRIPIPSAGKETLVVDRFRQILTEKEVAAFIFEPLVQGAAGMQMYAPQALEALLQIAHKNGVITIADEVMTGFGKTGKTFACDYLHENPDIICLSKALTGGTIPLAVTATTQRIFDAFYHQDVDKALFHGHTFMANPTACAIALEALNLLFSQQMQQNIRRIEAKHRQFIQKHQNNPAIENIRQLGVILAFELKVHHQADYYGNLRNQLYRFFISEGVILRPIGNSIYLLPPYIITDQQLDTIYKVLEKAIERFATTSFF